MSCTGGSPLRVFQFIYLSDIPLTHVHVYVTVSIPVRTRCTCTQLATRTRISPARWGPLRIIFLCNTQEIYSSSYYRNSCSEIEKAWDWAELYKDNEALKTAGEPEWTRKGTKISSTQKNETKGFCSHCGAKKRRARHACVKRTKNLSC